ncbi:MAG: M50 family metallopeptidase [Paenibacillaceae bacterium]
MNKWFGTVYRFHPLFVLMMLLSILTGYFIELFTLFGIIFIHELGHVTMAKSFGWRVMEVQLLPFGGVAVVEESGNIPAYEELWVALAGPAQNAWMAFFAFLMMKFSGADSLWWEYFLQANVMIGLFNMLPVLPLDGGKVLVSLLSFRLCYYKTLHICAWFSLGLSCMIIIAAFISIGTQGGVQLNVLIIGLFLLYSNWISYRHIPYQFRRFLMSREGRATQHLAKGTLAQPILVGGHKEISMIVQLFMREKYHLIYILSKQGNIQKVLTEQRLIHSYFSEAKSHRAVSEIFV